ncbi:SCO7613 C-terminal domain-containing membrane protein [Blastococcus deserti]|uniref:SCO7613 C-terminal domain-containing membrane protein n=1 Tax=Blastococcus deserti TaxID=2259033 RepID=A0ABW4XFL0_9ACTN
MTTFSALQCPVCGRPVEDPPPPACPACGLPGVGQAARVMTRIGVTLRDLAAERDAFLQTLHAAASARTPVTGEAPGRPPQAPVPAPAPPAGWRPPAPPTGWRPPAPPPLPPTPRRRLTPQEVLLGLGALLLVAAAVAFVAVAWTRLGVGFQAGVMSVVTAVACGASGWSARRGLRATEEALAAAGVALLAIDLAAARWLGLFRLEDVPLRTWTAVSCTVVVAAGLLLGRLTRSTTTWPLAALVAAQPVPFLLLPTDAVDGPAGVAAALALATTDLLLVLRLRSGLRILARVLAAGQAALGGVAGLLLSGLGTPAESWTATAMLAAAGAAAVAGASLRPELLPRPDAVAASAAMVAALSLAMSLERLGDEGPVVAAGLGIAVLTGAVLLVGRRAGEVAAWAGGATLTLVGAGLLAEEERWAALSVLALAAVVPSLLAAVRREDLRSGATGTALLAAAASIGLAHGGDLLEATRAGLLLALVAALGLAVATLRAGGPEERVAAGAAAVAGLAAAVTSGTVGAWGQVGLQLAVVGAAGAGYALIAGRRPVAVLAVADLVVAAWIALAGADVTTPEAYTLPAAAGLLLLALPGLRAGAPSWSAEGTGLAVGLAPSAMVVVADPTALRLVLLVAAAGAVTVVGTLAHRQAPFLVGAAALAFVAVGLLGPDVLLLPRWLTLGTVGLLLLVVGATYERRRQQAREAVAWVAQMR